MTSKKLTTTVVGAYTHPNGFSLPSWFSSVTNSTHVDSSTYNPDTYTNYLKSHGRSTVLSMLFENSNIYLIINIQKSLGFYCR